MSTGKGGRSLTWLPSHVHLCPPPALVHPGAHPSVGVSATVPRPHWLAEHPRGCCTPHTRSRHTDTPGPVSGQRAGRVGSPLWTLRQGGGPSLVLEARTTPGAEGEQRLWVLHGRGPWDPGDRWGM